ncbi:MAG TPA: prolyl oligopeptidase family serine peptidase [Ideonella sp.]|uniref:prolyl oligopeptidase family serine peptidase n=1 Tax=Ideonella sp. TaxID=1929293 RepID=UPI002B8D31F1|nr:prolyl oligopeptidase family serine peptidase [Ideonella sp.]HSI49663.1 prolyl oligopeptidase family serine peptidase [Ideonella sp.]
MSIHVSRRRQLILAACLFSLDLAAVAATPPAAPSQPVTETLHGVAVADPYRNLENLKLPETQAWLKAQGAYAAEQLAAIPVRDEIQQRIETLAKATGDLVRGVARMPGERYYYLKRKAGENQLKLVLRKGLGGAEQVLVDPEALTKAAGGVPHAINYFVPSWDGRYLAYGISAGGSEDASLCVMDLRSGKPVGEPVPRVHEAAVHWLPDSKALTYNQIRELPAGAPEAEAYMDSTVFLLKVGDPVSAARPLFGPLVNTDLKLDRLDVASVFFSPGSPYMVARTTDTTVPEGKVFVAPVASLNGKRVPWQQVSGFDDKITDVQLRGKQLFLRTYEGAPRGRVLALELAKPVLANAHTVVAEPATGVLESFALGRDAIYTEERQGFTLRTLRHAGGKTTDLALGLAGSTFLGGDPAHAYSDMLLTTSSWTEPATILLADGHGKVRNTGLRESQKPAGVPELVVSEVMVPSHDGVKVPLAILHRKGLMLNGSNPTLLVGYGAYGFSFEAGYDPRAYAWFERGGVLAMVNVRGSGAFGDPWYRAGFKATKPNTWKDGVAAARYLINQGYTSNKALGIWGTSAGGIFVGRAVTSAPDLFAAAIFDVGVMDAVRAEESANGVTNISEFGSAKNPAEFPALLEMSTYHQVKDGTAYPAVMFIHGLNDPRVDVWHSAKAAARLQAASTSGKPILLRLDGQAGHGVGSTAAQGYSKQADIYSFLLWQFGMAGTKPAN